MTNPVIDAVSLEMSGLNIEVVEPGSPSDPFAAANQPTSNENGTASPAFRIPSGVGEATPADGSKSQSGTPAQAPTPPPAPAVNKPAEATPAATLSPAEQALKDGRLDDYIAEITNTRVGEALRTQQSGYDKRINALSDELKASRAAAVKAEREAKLNSEDLTDEEKDTLRHKYELDDREAALNEYDEQLDSYYRSLVVAKLVESHGGYGVTAAELEAIDDPEEMEKFATEKELVFYRNGGTSTVPSRSIEATTTATQQEPEVPAGASAPTDVGGNAVVAPPAQLQSGSGADILRSNLEKLPWESVRMPN